MEGDENYFHRVKYKSPSTNSVEAWWIPHYYELSWKHWAFNGGSWFARGIGNSVGQAVNHMLSGNAVERTLRGHLLVEKALYALIISNHTGMDLPVMKQDVDQNATSREANERCENSTSIPADLV